ncbi:MAG TPA: hypothetical protein VL285_10865 [Bryobacteraceae bacterium]|nr:hypothetical protein [Bryobacteraceae bacterium]
MPIEIDRGRVAVEELATRIRSEMVPLGSVFSYFLVTPIADEDLKQYLEDPIAALPQAICGALPKIGILLVPYLEKMNGKGGDMVCFEKPAEQRQIFWSRLLRREAATLAFSVKDEEMADYHYSFYNAIAGLVAEGSSDARAKEQFYGLVREELAAEVHGEVDERSWRLKQSLLRRQTNLHKETKIFHDYVRQALEDTLTLFLHGICCDIDVETGPRQMPSRYLRKRLELLTALYPPPKGYAVLPEQSKKR